MAAIVAHLYPGRPVRDILAQGTSSRYEPQEYEVVGDDGRTVDIIEVTWPESRDPVRRRDVPGPRRARRGRPGRTAPGRPCRGRGRALRALSRLAHRPGTRHCPQGSRQSDPGRDKDARPSPCRESRASPYPPGHGSGYGGQVTSMVPASRMMISGVSVARIWPE